MNKALRRKLTTDYYGNLCTVPSASGLPTRKFLTAAGDGSGAFNLNGNYSASALTAYYETPVPYDIYSVLVCISDATKFLQSGYGGMTSLTNGVRFYLQPAGFSDISLLTNVGIVANYDWLSVAADVRLTSFDLTPQTLTVYINIREEYGKPLQMSAGDKFKVVLNDDFSGLVSHTFGLRGIQFP